MLQHLQGMKAQHGAPCPTSLGKVLLQFFNHLLRLGKFELSWRALLYTSPEFSTAVVRAQQRHLEAAPPRLGGVHLHRQLWGLQLQSLAQGSSVAPVDASARAMLNDHRRALRQFLSLVHSLCRRGLPLSSVRGHGGDLRRQMQCGAGRIGWRRKPKRQTCSPKSQLPSTNLSGKEARVNAPT